MTDYQKKEERKFKKKLLKLISKKGIETGIIPGTISLDELIVFLRNSIEEMGKERGKRLKAIAEARIIQANLISEASDMKPKEDGTVQKFYSMIHRANQASSSIKQQAKATRTIQRGSRLIDDIPLKNYDPDTPSKTESQEAPEKNSQYKEEGVKRGIYTDRVWKIVEETMPHKRIPYMSDKAVIFKDDSKRICVITKKSNVKPRTYNLPGTEMHNSVLFSGAGITPLREEFTPEQAEKLITRNFPGNSKLIAVFNGDEKSHNYALEMLEYKWIRDHVKFLTVSDMRELTNIKNITPIPNGSVYVFNTDYMFYDAEFNLWFIEEMDDDPSGAYMIFKMATEFA